MHPRDSRVPYALMLLRSYALTLLRSDAPTLLRSYAPTLLRSYALTLLRSSAHIMGAQAGSSNVRQFAMKLTRRSGLATKRCLRYKSAHIFSLRLVFLPSQGNVSCKNQRYGSYLLYLPIHTTYDKQLIRCNATFTVPSHGSAVAV